MNISVMEIDKLKLADYNPRKDLKPGDPEYDKLKNSIEHFGYVEPVIVNDRTGLVVGGHQRLKVLRDLGYTSIEVVHVDLDENNEKALNIALNKISGDWDADKLEDILRELNLDDSFDVAISGFDMSELDTLFNGSIDVDENSSNGRNYGPSKQAKDAKLDEMCKEENRAIGNPRDIKEGDIYECGQHRIICGDSYNPETYKKLVGSDSVTMIFTDPPYKLRYRARGLGFGTLDNPEDIKKLNSICWRNMPGKNINTERSVTKVYHMGIDSFDVSNIEYLFNLGIKSMYFCCSVLSLVEYINLCIKYKYNYDVLVMYKTAVIPTHTNSYLNDLEYLVYCRLPNATFNGKIRDFQAYHKLVDEPGEREAVEKQFYSHVHRTSTSEGRRETKEYLDYELNHPTVKPLRLIIPKIAISSNPGDVVVDMFGGSGSTMIACEKLGRRCLMCEKLPEFVNETLDRWEAYTGLKAKKIEQLPDATNQPVIE